MPRKPSPRYLPIRIAAVGVVALVALVGCSSGSEAPEVASLGDSDGRTTAPEGAASKDREKALGDYARCMRDNGVVDFPDPTVDSEGNVRMSGMRDLDSNDPVVAKALEACDQLLESVRQDYSPDQQQDREDALLAYAQCMRDSGYPMADPDLSKMRPGSGGIFSELDTNDPAFQEADQVCRPKTLGDGGFGMSGQGGSGS